MTSCEIKGKTMGKLVDLLKRRTVLAEHHSFPLQKYGGKKRFPRKEMVRPLACSFNDSEYKYTPKHGELPSDLSILLHN